MLGVLLLLLSGGLCILGVGHAMANDLAPDLCVLMFAVPLAALLLSGPVLSGWAQTHLASRLAPAPIQVPDLPPEVGPALS